MKIIDWSTIFVNPFFRLLLYLTKEHFQNRDGVIIVWQAEKEVIRRRAGMKASFTDKYGERAEEPS
jgi:hypothetical protein